MNKTAKIIQRNIVRLRDEYGYTDAALARVAGVYRSDVSRYTNGHIDNPKFDFLDKLCAVFSVTLVELMKDVPMSSDAYSANERALIMRLRRMDDAQRDAVERVARALAPDE